MAAKIITDYHTWEQLMCSHLSLTHHCGVRMNYMFAVKASEARGWGFRIGGFNYYVDTKTFLKCSKAWM